MNDKDKSSAKDKLSPEQYNICILKGTEAPFTGLYWNHKEPGVYKCACCNAALFGSQEKYDSGTGWPSYSRPLVSEAVKEVVDTTHGMKRTEIICGSCGAHLGHVFPDGPQSTGLRYCINSLSLVFVKDEES
ncbi:MAG: peptide-methionine (R)-S-oxide reductase MsrB [Gammaproteobacteria bacterium]|nr:peptide-methionine (R)-S-oxide reductase MsrB [Gammaproteobacteria bacterium]